MNENVYIECMVIGHQHSYKYQPT